MTALAPQIQTVAITPEIRALWGAKVMTDGQRWTGWAVWDDRDEECPVFRTLEEALAEGRMRADSMDCASNDAAGIPVTEQDQRDTDGVKP